MKEKLKLILENAIEEEEYFSRLYKELASLQTNLLIKKKLLELSNQEKMHKEKLESLDFVKLGAKVIPGVLDSIKINTDVSNTPKAEFYNIELMFKFAITQEALAKTSYKKLAEAFDDKSAKNLFLTLFKEEEMHEHLLIEQLNKFRSELNNEL
ncbi:hypothetical protein J4418_01965 [Candidatus Woesearchaeota archaeon]|nr:hypothetical protein [Candidatus Woesearchaeota archaeon]